MSASSSMPSVEAVLHHHHVREAQVAARAGAQRAADEVDGVGHLLRRRASSVPWSSSDATSCDEAVLARRIRGAARAHQQTHAHLRLLVVHHDHHLHAVGQRAAARTAGTSRARRAAAAAATLTASRRLRAGERARDAARRAQTSAQSTRTHGDARRLPSAVLMPQCIVLASVRFGSRSSAPVDSPA